MEAVVIALGYLQGLNGKALLLEIPHTLLWDLRNQVGPMLEESFLLVSFQSLGRCYVGC